MLRERRLTRRDFIKKVGVAGTSIVLGQTVSIKETAFYSEYLKHIENSTQTVPFDLWLSKVKSGLVDIHFGKENGLVNNLVPLLSIWKNGKPHNYSAELQQNPIILSEGEEKTTLTYQFNNRQEGFGRKLPDINANLRMDVTKNPDNTLNFTPHLESDHLNSALLGFGTSFGIYYGTRFMLTPNGIFYPKSIPGNSSYAEHRSGKFFNNLGIDRVMMSSVYGRPIIDLSVMSRSVDPAHFSLKSLLEQSSGMSYEIRREPWEESHRGIHNRWIDTVGMESFVEMVNLWKPIYASREPDYSFVVALKEARQGLSYDQIFSQAGII